MAADAARRGQGRGHPASVRGWFRRRPEIDGRRKQNLAYIPPGTSCGWFSSSTSAAGSAPTGAVVAKVVATPFWDPRIARSSRVATSSRPSSVQCPYVSAVMAIELWPSMREAMVAPVLPSFQAQAVEVFLVLTQQVDKPRSQAKHATRGAALERDESAMLQLLGDAHLSALKIDTGRCLVGCPAQASTRNRARRARHVPRHIGALMQQTPVGDVQRETGRYAFECGKDADRRRASSWSMACCSTIGVGIGASRRRPAPRLAPADRRGGPPKR